MLTFYRIHLPLRHPTKTAHGYIHSRPLFPCGYLVDNFTFWAEFPGFETDFYLPETHDLLWHRLQDIAPELLQSLQSLTPLIVDDAPILSSGCDALLCQVLAQQNGQSLMDYFGCHNHMVRSSAMVGILDCFDAYEAQLNDVIAKVSMCETESGSTLIGYDCGCIESFFA